LNERLDGERFTLASGDRERHSDRFINMRHMRHAQTADSFTGVADLRVAVDGQTPTRPCRCVRAPGGSEDTANALRGLERLTRELRQVNFYRLFSGAFLDL